MLVSPGLREKIGRFSLTGRGRVRSSRGGRHLSVHKGESIDFVDFREYTPGDDYRRIDHLLWARLGTPLIREFEAERELSVRVVVDRSPSMGFHQKHPAALGLAGLITYLALAGGDRVELWTLPGQGGRQAATRGPTGRHLSSWPRLEAWLEGLGIEPAEGTLGPALAAVMASGRRRYTALVSDLLVEDWRAGLDRLAGSAGGMVLHLLGSAELDPQVLGDVRLRDAETGEESDFSGTVDAYDRYRSRLDDLCEQMAKRSARSGLRYLLVEAGPDASERTFAGLAAAGMVR
ncbi:MAG: DUF58 domain-containing protein [bacterium]|nr:DUF58 domain-containing protein [Acidimicrobiia bacterium]MCY4651329.1 DUF58 domain-containing protein [bacterium]